MTMTLTAPETTTATTQTFTNVTIYLRGGMGNINRIDVRELTVERGVKYAQYNDAVRVTWLEKGKRKKAGLYLTYAPFLLVVNREDAIEPASIFGATELGSTPGVSVRRSRYSAFDDGWVRDFRALLTEKNVTPLVSIPAEDPTR